MSSLTPSKEINTDINKFVYLEVLHGMEINSKDRPQTVEEWLKLLHDAQKTSISDDDTPRRPRRFGKPLLIAVPLLTCALIAFSVQIAKIKTLSYNNKPYGFKLEYPQSWTLKDYPNPQIFTGIVTKLTPAVSPDQLEPAKLTVEVRNINPSVSLTDLKQIALKNLPKLTSYAEILESSETQIGNYPAYKLVYTGRDGDQVFKHIRISLIHNQKEYTLVYKSEISQNPHWESTALGIFDSFQLQE